MSQASKNFNNMTHREFIDWSEQQELAGVKDAMGRPWTDWLLAVLRSDGSVARDAKDHQIYENQTEFKGRMRAIPIGQTMELFA